MQVGDREMKAEKSPVNSEDVEMYGYDLYYDTKKSIWYGVYEADKGSIWHRWNGFKFNIINSLGG